MTLDPRSLALDVFAVAVIAGLGCGFYAEPEQDQPKCEALGATIEAAPDSGACVFSRLYAAGFAREFSDFPGVRVANVSGYVVRTARGSDGGAFWSPYWKRDVGGNTDCGNGTVDLARVPNNLVHEFVHAGEDCACVTLDDAGADCHIGWDERGVYAAIYRAERL